MYSVYALNYESGGRDERGHVDPLVWEKSLVYAPNIKGYRIFNAKLTTETNRAGSFSFSLTADHPALAPSNGETVLKKMKTIIAVFKDSREIWRGRILDEEVDFFNNVKFMCEGELAFLNDVLVDINISDPRDLPTKKELLTAIINRYNLRCSPYRGIRLGDVADKDALLDVPISARYEKALSVIGTELLDKCGGYLKLTRDTENDIGVLNYYNNEVEPVDEKPHQRIIFGQNLLDLSKYIDASNVYTSVIPMGEGDITLETGTNTIEDSNKFERRGAIIISNAGRDAFGIITKKVVFNDVYESDPISLRDSKLKSRAVRLLDKAISENVTITVRAVDLSVFNVEYESIEVDDRILVTSAPHGINDERFACSKIELDILNPAASIYTFGAIPETFTKQQARLNSRIESIN